MKNVLYVSQLFNKLASELENKEKALSMLGITGLLDDEKETILQPINLDGLSEKEIEMITEDAYVGAEQEETLNMVSQKLNLDLDRLEELDLLALVNELKETSLNDLSHKEVSSLSDFVFNKALDTESAFKKAIVQHFQKKDLSENQHRALVEPITSSLDFEED